VSATEKGKKNAITPKQCVAARALLGWNRKVLSDKSGVSQRTLARFEEEESVPGTDLLFAVWKTFREAGIVFVRGGVRAG
jgi:hypothetical protein